MKIIIAEKIAKQAADLLRAEKWDVIETSSTAELDKELPTAEALLVRSAVKVDAALLDKAPMLRVVDAPALAWTTWTSTRQRAVVSSS